MAAPPPGADSATAPAHAEACAPEQAAVPSSQHSEQPAVPHAQAAWAAFRSWGAPKFHVAPMVDAVRGAQRLSSPR